MLRERLPSIVCRIRGHDPIPFGRRTTSQGVHVSLTWCRRCHRVTVLREDDYPEILPAPPWSEAEARAALLLGTAVMDLPVLGPVQGAGTPPRDPLSALETGVDDVLWFDPVADQWSSRSSTGARVPVDVLLTSLPHRSRNWHN
jgi:hypothetical protein